MTSEHSRSGIESGIADDCDHTTIEPLDNGFGRCVDCGDDGFPITIEAAGGHLCCGGFDPEKHLPHCDAERRAEVERIREERDRLRAAVDAHLAAWELPLGERRARAIDGAHAALAGSGGNVVSLDKQDATAAVLVTAYQRGLIAALHEARDMVAAGEIDGAEAWRRMERIMGAEGAESEEG